MRNLEHFDQVRWDHLELLQFLNGIVRRCGGHRWWEQRKAEILADVVEMGVGNGVRRLALTG